jgi:4-hydroxy-tetrahydrodipicolinate synthase
MTLKTEISGIIPAVATPFDTDGRVHTANLRQHIEGLADEGCAAALLMGTTGEGPSLGYYERDVVIATGLEAQGRLKILAGTGTASLTDTIAITRRAFELGVDGVVVIPPFFFKKVSDAGLFDFYTRLLDQAVPDDGLLFLYHFPNMSAVPLSAELIEKLVAHDPRVAGVKDSSGDLENTRMLSARFPQLRIFSGNDRHVLPALQGGAAGAMTAGTNLLAPIAVQVYRLFQQKKEAAAVQDLLTAARITLEKYGSFPAVNKAALARRYHSMGWEVRPPLVPLTADLTTALLEELVQVGAGDLIPWLKQAV